MYSEYQIESKRDLRASRVTKWHTFTCSVTAWRSQSSRRCVCFKCGRRRRGSQCSMLALIVSYSQVGVLGPVRASQRYPSAYFPQLLLRLFIVDATNLGIITIDLKLRGHKAYEGDQMAQIQL